MVPRIWETVGSHLGTGGDGMSTGLKSKVTNCRLPKCLLYFSPKSTYFFIIVSSVCFGVMLRETLPPGDYINSPLQFFLLFLVGFFFFNT